MKILNKNFFIILTLLLLLSACNKEEKAEKPELIVGSPAYFYEQGLETSDLDEKLRLYNAGLEAVKSSKDTNLVSLLDGKIYVLQRKGQLEQSAEWIDKLIEAAEFKKDTYFLAKGYYRRSKVHLARNQPELAFKDAFIARQLNLRDGDTAAAARRSFDMADAQIEMGDYPGSQESAAEALQYLNPQTDSIFISAAHNLIGLAYMDQGFNEDAIKEYKQALKFAARKEDSLTFLHNIAISYKNEKKYEKAINILEDIISSKEPDSASKSRFLDNLAYSYWLQDSTAQVDSLFFKAIAIREQINDQAGLYTSFSHLADYYENRDREKAIGYARASLEKARESSSALAEIKALKKLISLTEGREAQNYVDRFVFLHDSVDQANLQAKNYFAKIRLDEKKKQQEINSLEQLNYKQALEAERLQNRNLLSSFVAIFIFLAALLLFFVLRQRNKRERLRGIYLTEKRISKRIHDELANDVYNLMSGLEDQTTLETRDKLARIYSRTRDISRENSEVDTGSDYLNNLVAIMSSIAGNAKIILKGEKSVNWQGLAEEKKIVIYRVLQELMVNMKKHSKAQFVAVSFSEQGKWLEINYKDNGVGCESCAKTGNGLNNIKNRIASINGKINIESEKGKGFKVELRIPV